MAPADACEAAGDAGDGTQQSPHIALDTLLELQQLLLLQLCWKEVSGGKRNGRAAGDSARGMHQGMTGLKASWMCADA